MLIQRFDRFDRLADFDPNTGAYSEFIRPADLIAKSTGQYGLIGDYMLILYRLGESLFIRVSDTVLELDERVSIRVERSLSHNTIAICRNDTILFQWNYQAGQQEVPIEDDPSAFVEEEDFDFALFLANISNDDARQLRLFKYPSAN
jgi:hypothetical protein